MPSLAAALPEPSMRSRRSTCGAHSRSLRKGLEVHASVNKAVLTESRVPAYGMLLTASNSKLCLRLPKQLHCAGPSKIMLSPVP